MAHHKLLDDPERCVDDMLQGLQAAFPGLRVLEDSRAVTLRSEAGDTVGLVSGGGAGHEPFCAGFVGTGMLAAAVSGSVFASPPATHVQRALADVASRHKGGVLLVIPNYTGDCLNFGLASEWARRDGVQVESVIVDDDCSLLESGKGSSTGSRGMCGLIFVYKIAGQLASEGLPLKKVAEVAKRVVDSTATMGLAIRSCILPGSIQPLLNLAPGSVELGVGVHGEAGLKTVPMAPASELISQILDPIQRTLKLQKGEKVAVLVNNLGGLSQLEQYVAVKVIHEKIVSWGVEIVRLYAAPLMTSLETSGVQVSILRLTDADWLRCLDAPSSAPAWPGRPSSIPPTKGSRSCESASQVKKEESKNLGPELEHSLAEILKSALEAAAMDLIHHADKMNELDSGCGDGDCGSTLARLAKALITELPNLQVKHPAQLLLQLANLASVIMGGTSGAVYGLLFSAASSQLSKVKCIKDTISLLEHLATSWEEGLQGIMRHSKARQGDRTMLDALIPACQEFRKAVSKGTDGLAAFEAAVSAAKQGCADTAKMFAKVGRASYVNESHLSNVDAGAYGVVVWLESLLKTFCKKT
ncbi:PTS-dependent dihydroxyacetone kinase 1, dihydroxyacetone-binding subunit DhaK-like [Thrips palmi]|uniref:Triokinase/FMN cyclase n=1 Tax=Thrips palmi TaxID=161013 RepID=A0A6P9A8W6_THRPL|nr:PTS-dependent dihydroxyacetone kinase 1, dihydroxyacetone-binding subunit DhaK-like [Thrips palmi]XP_034253978.1 PTS-dependent dihydroxyacetone kinase 1, dihydroxyacetone-binding subunit DhaK-like [Thrips palmi]XP_034253979.1 PTS-dependent dihydroxyacetone kinase 1, dihydroxyacetone-binding subunit DhaK-like [Thrips palmi]XP_034253980.1 PTS-dependent dihydroxyacetone kinase 1, dihydroxyacetone-binding subunit DhaK-like [Thrips palmi]